MEQVRGDQAQHMTSDEGLVAAARSGDVGAFGALFDRYDRPLRHYLVRLCGEDELAADISQDAFVEAFQKLGQLEDEHSFAAWLHRIARNRMRMEWRRRRLQRFVSLDGLKSEILARLASPPQLDDLPAMQGYDAIQWAIDALSPPLKEALLLNRLSGLTSLEIAHVLHISHQAAMKRVSRAVEQFRANYEEASRD